MALGLALTTISTFFDLIFVLRWNDYFYINSHVFVIVTNIFEDFIHTRYIFIATGVICARITPSSLEGTVYNLFTGVGNLGFGVVGILFGNYCAAKLGIDEHNLNNLYKGMIIKLFLSLIPFAFLGWIYNKQEIEHDEKLSQVNQLDNQKLLCDEGEKDEKFI